MTYVDHTRTDGEGGDAFFFVGVCPAERVECRLYTYTHANHMISRIQRLLV